MSAREAFAWSYGKTLNVGTTLVPTGGPHCTAASVATAVKSINSAVAARERQAAADALREAADERAGDAGDDAVCRWLRFRADAIEKGEA